MTIVLERSFLPGTDVKVVPRGHLEGDPPRGPILATGTTDSRGFTTIEGLSKRGSGQVAGSILRCAVMPSAGGGPVVTIHVGHTMALQYRVLTHT